MTERDSVAARTFAFTDLARSARTIDQLNNAFGEFISPWGFTNWACARISADTNSMRKPLHRFFGNPNAPWMARYHANRYVYDDVVTKELMVRDVAFYWSELDTSRFMTERARTILGEATEFGWKAGASVPVRLFDGSVWGVTMGGEKIEQNPVVLDALELAAQFYAARAAYIFIPERNHRLATSRLTDAQCNIVSRLAKGLTQNQIALELNVSVKMIEKHLVQAREKFGSSTTAQLVAEALLSGDISPQ